MHLMKHIDGWTRRHFLDQVGKGVFAAGVLSALTERQAVEAAYPRSCSPSECSRR